MAHAQKPDFVFRRNGRVHLNRQGRQFSRLLAAEVCASRVVMLDTPCSEVVWRVLPTHSIRQFPLHFPTRASPCAITFQLDSTILKRTFSWVTQPISSPCPHYTVYIQSMPSLHSLYPVHALITQPISSPCPHYTAYIQSMPSLHSLYPVHALITQPISSPCPHYTI
jgi:hypothetical protein